MTNWRWTQPRNWTLKERTCFWVIVCICNLTNFVRYSFIVVLSAHLLAHLTSGQRKCSTRLHVMMIDTLQFPVWNCDTRQRVMSITNDMSLSSTIYLIILLLISISINVFVSAANVYSNGRCILFWKWV